MGMIGSPARGDPPALHPLSTILEAPLGGRGPAPISEMGGFQR